MVERIEYNSKTGKLHINDKQYFDNIPLEAWSFYLGGYQLAHKWIKDRKGSILSFQDISRYESMIATIIETQKIVKIIG